MKKIKIIIKCLAFLMIFSLAFGYTENVLSRKDYIKYTDFYEHAEEYDVLFFGTSHAINGIFPQELWNDYGITSYNMSQHAEQIPVTYYNIENALAHSNPKLVVLDIYHLFNKNAKKYNEDIAYLHKSFDHMNLSVRKLSAVNDILENENSQKAEMLFPFTLYHSRYKELTQEDFIMPITKELGAETRIDVYNAKYDSSKMLHLAQKWKEVDTIGMEYLEKIVDLCQEKEIDLLLTHIPYFAKKSRVIQSNYIDIVAKEYGIQYVNMIYGNQVNYNTDFFDERGHLNPSGARKVTDYLGKYIINNYQITDHRNDSSYQEWPAYYEEYKLFKIKNLNDHADNLTNYLMLMQDKNFDFAIKIKRDFHLLDDLKVISLLENLNISVDDIKSSDTDYYHVYSNACGTIQNNSVNFTFSDTDGEAYDLQILIFDENGTIVSTAKY